ncbi:MAG: hypothetical protein F4Y57_15525, partial [Acidobacteria bacterium]|nr:hypothetical protein [Acidobacteriota bacterium]
MKIPQKCRSKIPQFGVWFNVAHWRRSACSWAAGRGAGGGGGAGRGGGPAPRGGRDEGGGAPPGRGAP